MVAQRLLRILVILLVPVTVLVGCKSNNTSSSAPADSDSSQSLPADPAQSSSDSAPFDASCPTSNTTAFAKTKFVAHAGAGFGAFHHWIYKPYRDGKFAKGAHGRIRAFVKGGLAALFVKREVRLALNDAKANPTLCKAIAAPLANIGNSISGAYDKLKGGDSSGIDSVNSNISSVENSSNAQGDSIKEDDNPNINKVPS
jgi:hypothetical protein